MDIGTLAAKVLRKQGKLDKLDESEEINACTVKMTINHDGKEEDWLLLFKNETHNHPTEIEPFGGAATCIGGAIRDPLSGRSYVYAAMRVTGAADPLKSFSETMEGKLPQRKLVTTAANGYSSYGNQIGLATGIVDELYHDGYAAKRMEIGAVIAAAPAENVRRERPDPGDVVILLGGRTGRDGIGGATGFIPSSPSTPAVPKSRRVTRPKSANSRDCSATPKRQSSSSAATTSVRAVFPLPSVNLPMVWRSTSTRSRRSTKASTAPNSPFPSLRSVWPSSSSRKTWLASRNWPLRRISSPPSWPPLLRRRT